MTTAWWHSADRTLWPSIQQWGVGAEATESSWWSGCCLTGASLDKSCVYHHWYFLCVEEWVGVGGRDGGGECFTVVPFLIKCAQIIWVENWMFLECFPPFLSFVSRRDAATKSKVATGRQRPRKTVPILNLRSRAKLGIGVGGLGLSLTRLQ